MEFYSLFLRITCFAIVLLGSSVYLFLFKFISQKKLIFLGIIFGMLSALGVLLTKNFLFSSNYLSLNYPEELAKEILSQTVFLSFLEAGALEEIFKTIFYLFFLKFLEFKSLKLNINNNLNNNLSSLDIFLLGGAVGFGFGFLENLFYADYFSKLIYENLLSTVNILWQRNFTSLLLHTTMGMIFSFMRIKNYNLLTSLIVIIILHGIYDFFAIPMTILGIILVNIFLLLDIVSCFYMAINIKNINKIN